MRLHLVGEGDADGVPDNFDLGKLADSIIASMQAGPIESWRWRLIDGLGDMLQDAANEALWVADDTAVHNTLDVLDGIERRITSAFAEARNGLSNY